MNVNDLLNLKLYGIEIEIFDTSIYFTKNMFFYKIDLENNTYGIVSLSTYNVDCFFYDITMGKNYI